MKKLSLLLAASALTATTFAALPSYVKFSSTGPDQYADGTTVLDNEVYALVWTAKGAEFQGFNADGTLVDTTANKLISAAPVAKGGRCPTVIYVLTDENIDLEGSFDVYLLDTRVVSADGTKTIAGVTDDGALKVINTSSVLTAETEVVRGQKTTAASPAAAESAVVSSDLNAPTPTITAVKVVGGKVIVKVADTVPYLQYGISAGKTPSVLDQKDLVQGVNGTAEGLTLVVDDPAENRFFKVIRK